MVDAIKQHGVAEYKLYDDERHAFARVENQIDADQQVTDFLKELWGLSVRGPLLSR
jgi:dipeptidyl aminopeptidase/acylaminoacyl peptidase